MSELRLNTAGQFATYRFIYASTGNTIQATVNPVSVTVSVVKGGSTLTTIAGTTANVITVVDGIYTFVYSAGTCATPGEYLFGFNATGCLPFEMQHSVITVKEWDHKYSTATVSIDDVKIDTASTVVAIASVLANYAQASAVAAVKVDTASCVVAIASVRANMGYASTEAAIKVDTASCVVAIASVLANYAQASFVAAVKVDTASCVVAIASVRANMGYASTEAAIKVDTASCVVAIASVRANMGYASTEAAIKVETASMLAKIDILDTVADAIKVDTASTVVAIASVLANYAQASFVATLDAKTVVIDGIVDNIKIDTTSILTHVDNIGSVQVAIDAVHTGMVYASQVATVATVTAGIWDAVASSYDDAGSMGALLNDAGAAGDPWSVDLPGSYTGLDAGAILSQINVNMSSTVIAVASVRANMAYASTTNTINTNVSSAVTWISSVHANLVTVDGIVDTINAATGTTIPNQITTVKVDTASVLAYVDNIASVQVAVDNLTINGAQASLLLTQTQINAQVLSALDTQDIVQASEMASLSGADVWNAMASTYDTAGTLGEALNNASAAGDPWNTNLPGSYTGVQAGAILGTTITTQTNKITSVQTAVDAILVDTGTTLDGRIPAALVSGRMDASIGAVAAGAIGAAAFANDALSSLALSADAVRKINEGAAVHSGTAQAGSSYDNIILATTASSTNDTYIGCLVTIVVGTGVGQARIIADYVGSTRTAVVDNPWVTAPAVDSQYRIYPFSGILIADSGVPQAVADTTITLATTAPAVTNMYVGHTVFISGGTGAGQARIITGYTNTRIATVRAWTTNPTTSSVYMILPIGRVYVNEINPGAITSDTFTSTAIAAIQTDMAQASATTAIKVETASTLARIVTIGGTVDSILTDTGTTLDTKIDNIKVETASTLARIVALNNISAADVNAQVLDVLNVDTFAEPGQEAPAATNTLVKKISYLFKALRNKITQTSTTTSIYNDAGDTVDQKATVTDDGSIFTRGEFGTGA